MTIHPGVVSTGITVPGVDDDDDDANALFIIRLLLTTAEEVRSES